MTGLWGGGGGRNVVSLNEPIIIEQCLSDQNLTSTLGILECAFRTSRTLNPKP